MQALENVQVQNQASSRSSLTSLHVYQLLLQNPRLAESTCCVQALPPR